MSDDSNSVLILIKRYIKRYLWNIFDNLRQCIKAEQIIKEIPCPLDKFKVKTNKS